MREIGIDDVRTRAATAISADPAFSKEVGRARVPIRMILITATPLLIV